MIEVEEHREVISEVVPKKSNPYPNINGVYTGEISIQTIRDNKISCGDKEIQSFTLQYYDGKKEVVKAVIGNQIPEEICDLIEDHNWGSMIFLTEIVANDINGKKTTLPSMNFIPH